MGRMQDALKKAAEERERRRMADARVAAPAERGQPPIELRREDEAAVVTRALERHRAGEAAKTAPPEARRQADERLVVFHSPTDERAEEFRKIRATLLALEPRPRTILVTSGAPGEGKSLMAANLALTLLEMGEREVLVVDANLRHPELSEILGAPEGPGLADLVAAPGSAAVANAIVKTAVPRLFLLPAGHGGIAAARQLQPAALRRVLEGLEERFGFIIVDTPAACDYADAILLSNDVDGVLVVVKVGSGRRAATKKVIDDLESARARLLGTVVLTGS
jgi:capsular exopolysaccharide synthesis family protein